MMGRVSYWTIWVMLFLGFALSIISALEACTEECKEAHGFEFFGLPIGWIGVAFFIIAMGLHYFQKHTLLGMAIGGALGVEVVFLLIQYEIIGEWCPVCVSIAACIFVIGCVQVINFFSAFWNNLKLGLKSMLSMQVLRGVTTLSCVMLGFFLALFGVIKPEKTFADGTSENEDPIFGNRSSAIEVYVISDWFCPACREIEPKLDLLLPKIMEKAAVIFVDRNIHSESMNYMPYNLSFMLKEKDKYLALRKELLKLSLKTKTPSPDVVQKAIQPLGVTLTPLNFSDIDSGHRFFQGIAKTFQVDSTPTIVIANKKKVKAKKLVGNDEITEKNILGWIQKLS